MNKRQNPKLLINQQMSRLKKSIAKVWTKAKPFLALKYWPFYLASFCIGFYLWGPAHGWQKIKHFKISKNYQQGKNPATETLQKQINQLKQELIISQREKKIAFEPSSFSSPALGQVIKGFEWFESNKTWKLHNGVDIALKPDSHILSAAAGTVSEINKDSNGTYTVIIDHGNDWKTVYSNLAQVMVHQGQEVIKGVIIATSSMFGCDSKIPGCHFSVYHQQQPVDPEIIINGLTD